jgi:hypothetical protein
MVAQLGHLGLHPQGRGALRAVERQWQAHDDDLGARLLGERRDAGVVTRPVARARHYFIGRGQHPAAVTQRDPDASFPEVEAQRPGH